MKGFFAAEAVQRHNPSGSLVPKCGACGLYKRCETPKMKSFGEGRKKVLVVGEAPGATEDEEGRPFIGKAGQMLRGVLGGLGIKLDRDALTTNALICRPPGNVISDPKQIGYCRPNLLNTIQDFEPTVIVTLGRSALVAVLQDYWKEDIGPLERWVGWQIPGKGHWICPTYHPSYLLRINNQMMDRIFSEHLEAAFALEKSPEPREDLAGQVEVLFDSDKTVSAIKEMSRRGGWVSVDYETNCIKPDWPKAQLYSCSLSNGERTISYPWVGESITATQQLLYSNRIRKIASNLKMEERWTLKEFDHGVVNWGWDSMLAAHCLDNRPGICSLKFQLLVKMGMPLYNRSIEPYLKSVLGSPYNRIHEIDPSKLLLYGGIDGIGEYRLAMMQRAEMGCHD